MSAVCEIGEPEFTGEIHQHCLHLYGLADGARVLPDFAEGGLI